MKIFVAGGTGVVGRTAVPRLVAAGHDVTVVARSADKDRAVEAMGATPVRVDLFDRAAVSSAVAGHEAVVNLATNIPPMSKAMRPSAWATNDRLRTEASRHLADAVVEHGARRFVQESITFPYLDGGDDWVDETAARSDSPFTVGATTAEANAASVTDRGAAGVVLRFAQFYGPAASHTEFFVKTARRGVSPLMGTADGYTSFVHAADAGAAVLAALDVPAGVYNVAESEPHRRREVDAAMAAALGRKRLRRMPSAPVKAVNKGADVLMRSHRISNRAFVEASGWQPVYPDPLVGWAEVIAQVRGS